MDPCAFDTEGQVRAEPYQLRFYPAFDYRQVACTLREYERDHGGIPESKVKFVERVKGSIAKEGLRNPLIVQWYTEDPRKPLRWMVTIGNNRYVALEELGFETAPTLLIWPTTSDMQPLPLPPISGDYEELPFLTALALFDATYPWWNSAVMRRFVPHMVPRCFTG